MSARPSAPLWVTKPTSPGGGSPWSEGRIESRPRRRVENTEAVGTEQPHPRVTTDLEQIALEPGAVGPRFREARRDHDEGPDALLRALLRDLDHGTRRNRDDGELDLVGDLGDARIRPHRLHDVARRVDGVHRTVEVGLEQVVKDLAADRPSRARGADDGHRPGGEEAPHRGTGRQAVAMLEALDRLGGEGGRHLDSDRARLRGDLERQAALAEYLDHPVVLGHDLSDEGRYPVLLGDLGEMGEQQRPEAPSLHLVGDREGDLRLASGLAEVDPLAHDAIVVAAQRDQAVASGVIDVDHRPSARPGGLCRRRRSGRSASPG